LFLPATCYTYQWVILFCARQSWPIPWKDTYQDTYQLEGHPNPTWDSNSSRVSTINDILLETRRWESVADHREPLTWEMVEYQQDVGAKSTFLSLDAALANWFVVGMYTGFRLSEWAQPSSTIHSTNTFQRSRDGSSTAIIVSDVVFGHRGKEIFFTVTWRW
jgi:hypothetical protein